MKEGFVNGFYNNMTTQHIKNSYPISLINMLLSKTMLWFSIVMVILLSLIFLLVNNLKMFKMFKLLLIGILVDSFVIGIVLVILVETQSSVFTSGLTIPFLPILIIASGIIAYLRIRAMRTKHKES
jgi:asparagine N-glycosylation enzyme membrane subunit Stt3